MAILFNLKVFDGSISGAGAAVYSAPEHNTMIAQAEKGLVFVRAAQTAGTGTPSVTVELEHSNDNENWAYKIKPIDAMGLTGGQLNTGFGADDGSVVGGAFQRLKIYLGGTTPAGSFQVWYCGRTND